MPIRPLPLLRNSHWKGAGLAGVLAVSCAPQQRRLPVPSIHVVQDTVVLRPIADPPGVGLSVTAVVRNDVDRVLYRSTMCGEALQREIEGAWHTVWTPICASIASYEAVAPGGADTVNVRAFASETPAVHPRRDPRMVAGRYRLVMTFGYAVDEVGVLTPSQSTGPQATPPFIVRDP